MTIQHDFSDSPRLVSDDEESDIGRTATTTSIIYVPKEEPGHGIDLSPSGLLATSKEQFKSIINSK
jgi:hypothetical protein